MEQPNETGSFPNVNEALAIMESQKQSGQAREQQYYLQEAEKGIAEAQLEVEKTLEKCYHLLKQDRIVVQDSGKMDWVALKDLKRRVLSDEGVEKIMQTMSFYINKENLLSNFDELMINRIMYRFRITLNSNFFMQYETYFRQPTFNECKEILDERLEDKKKLKVYAAEFLGLQPDEKRIKQSLYKEVEQHIEKEMLKIKVEKRKQNLREWEMVFEQLSQLIFATLNRAWRGEERGSLRRHTQISEVLGKSIQATAKDGGFSWGRN